MTTLTRDTLFRPAPSKAETKADITDRVAREIIEAETSRRQALTEKLRAARLEQEARAGQSGQAPKGAAGKRGRADARSSHA